MPKKIIFFKGQQVRIGQNAEVGIIRDITSTKNGILRRVFADQLFDMNDTILFSVNFIGNKILGGYSLHVINPCQSSNIRLGMIIMILRRARRRLRCTYLDS